MLANKDYIRILEITDLLADTIITIKPDNPRALSSSELAKEARVYCDKVYDAGCINEAIKLAYQKADKDDVIIAFVLYIIWGSQ